jgi:LysR family glycine cleavage system transcriptional activator
MMIDRIPPLQTLRAFEAAARHLSYSRAAEELALTHGAISHHIARLERDLGGVRLFVRDGQRMLLTESGQVLVLQVRQGLQVLNKAFDDARSSDARQKHLQRLITVSVLPSFAARWLVPRLPRFQAAYPDVDVALRPSSSLVRLDGRDGIDLAIRYGPGGWVGLKTKALFASTIFPVCSQGFFEEYRPRIPTDLKDSVLLRNPRQPWRPWFAAAGLDWAEPTHGPSYEDAGLLLQAAAGGQGVALARAALLGDSLISGQLVRLFNVEVEDDYSWFAVWREPLRCDPAAFEAFRSWLAYEAAVAAPIVNL